MLSSLPEDGPAREAWILANLPRFPAPVWHEVHVGPITLQVSRDYVCERAPMAPATAQAAADYYGAVLPTPVIVEAIEAAARACGGLIPFDPWPVYQTQLETRAVLWREANILRHGDGAPIVAGHLKDVVLAPFMPKGRVVIFGAIQLVKVKDPAAPDGFRMVEKRVQPVYPIPGGAPGHGDYFGQGYAGGTRCVRLACTLDGQPTTVPDLLAKGLLGGPVAHLRYDTKGSTVPTVSTVLRFGSKGPTVAELQRLLTAAGWYTKADADFGRLTEAAVKAFQLDRGLTCDGIAGKDTLAALRDDTEDAAVGSGPTDPDVPFVQARNFHTGRLRPIRCVVLHTTEAAETLRTAENVAAWFAGSSAPMASAHFCVDSDSVIQCVREEDTAFAAPGLNSDGIQIEMAGAASQTAADWSDAYSQAMLARTARLVAGLCRRHGLPVAFVDAAGLLRGEKGVSTHAEVTKAYRQSTHTDPGKGFDMEAFLEMVRAG